MRIEETLTTIKFRFVEKSLENELNFLQFYKQAFPSGAVKKKSQKRKRSMEFVFQECAVRVRL